VAEQIGRIRKHRLHMVIGFVKDKDLAKVLPLLPRDGIYYFTKSSVERALDEKILQTEASHFGLTGKAYKSVGIAISEARAVAGKDDMIFIGGSTFIVADALSQF
jgi:dihydrofolate synthase/folylpolyglutamate synthase